MGLAAQSINLGTLTSGKLGERMRRDGDDGVNEAAESGCWMKFRLFGGCIPSSSKADSSASGGSSTQFGNSPLIIFSFLSFFTINRSYRNCFIRGGKCGWLNAFLVPWYELLAVYFSNFGLLEGLHFEVLLVGLGNDNTILFMSQVVLILKWTWTPKTHVLVISDGCGEMPSMWFISQKDECISSICLSLTWQFRARKSLKPNAKWSVF